MTLILGKDAWRFRVKLTEDLHRRSMYLLGMSGTGKSTLIANLALQCHALGEGVLVVDIKDGQLTKDIASRTPRPEDTIYVAPGLARFDGEQHYWGLNILEYDRSDPDNRELAAAEVVTGVMKMFERMARADPHFMTDVRSYLNDAVRVAVARSDSTLIDVKDILLEQDHRASRLASPVPPETRRNWGKFDLAYKSYRDQFIALKSTFRRVGDFTDDPFFNFMVSQPRSTIRLSEWLDQGKMVLCNLAEGIAEAQREPLGNLIMALASSAAFRRRVIRSGPHESRYWRYFIDEFDLLAPDQFADIIDKARGFRVLPVMAHQNEAQLLKGRAKDSRIHGAASNVPIKFRFPLSDEDRHTARFRIGEEEIEAIGALAYYTARVEVKGSPPDSGFPQTVMLQPLEGDPDEDQLRRLIAAQLPYTRSKREIARDNRERYYGEPRRGTTVEHERPAPRSSKRTQTAPPHQAEPVHAGPGGEGAPAADDRAGTPDPPAPGSVPVPRKRPGRKDFV